MIRRRRHQSIAGRRLPGCENRRAAPRHAREFDVAAGSHHLRALNISATGIRVVSAHPLADQEITLSIPMESGYSVEVRGRPVWQQTLGGETHVVGIAFAPDPVAQTRLCNWLDCWQLVAA
ncbi:MAG: PilZ domain-containing protein [Candidatus Eremiobacteraeota bacterium]|nr:PilZ domain-containing protein [Candidatus Eremiobacteraeota bacterium]